MSKEKVNCEICNKSLSKYPSQIKNSKTGRFFCSKECRSSHRSQQVVKHRFSCEHCGKSFQRTERELKNHKAKGSKVRFCSKNCRLEYKAVPSIFVDCSTCGKEITKRKTDLGENNFCDMDCVKNFKEMTTLACEECNEEFKKPTSYIKKQSKRGQDVKFCSKKCHYKNIRKEKVEVVCYMCQKRYMKNKYYLNTILAECCSGACKKAYFKKHHRSEVVCTQCQKHYTVNNYRADSAKNHFCDIDCLNEYRATLKETYAEVSHYLRSSTAYKKWRLAVFEKDDYKCIKCGAKNNFHAHHNNTLFDICMTYEMNIEAIINSFEFNDVSNGQTMCPGCHQEEHPFIRNDKGQFCRPNSKPLKS